MTNRGLDLIYFEIPFIGNNRLAGTCPSINGTCASAWPVGRLVLEMCIVYSTLLWELLIVKSITPRESTSENSHIADE
jgi:hypothetical protein